MPKQQRQVLQYVSRTRSVKTVVATLVVMMVCNASRFNRRTVAAWWNGTAGDGGLAQQPSRGILTKGDTEASHPNNRTWPESLIHDPTLAWDPDVHRPWLDAVDATASRRRRPPAVILLTTYGWNHPDVNRGKRVARSIRETELFTGVINHPWFHPTLWEDVERRSRSSDDDVTMRRWLRDEFGADTRFYVFTDSHQCGESNYPLYGGGRDNMDTRFNRTRAGGGRISFVHRPTVNSRLFTLVNNNNVDENNNNINGSVVTAVAEESTPPRAVAITLDCRGWGVPGLHHGENRVNGTTASLPLSVVSLSSLISVSHETWDQGLIPPACKPSRLTTRQARDIATCDAETRRRFYFAYAGNYRVGRNGAFTTRYGGARGAYKRFNDNERFFVTRYFADEFQKSALSNYTYQEFMSETIFALSSRGDNKFSYRFTEVLSAGAIPVVHADDWVWPFRPELVDWKECAVILPEKDAGDTTIRYLESISLERRCRMRQACYRIYKTYAETAVGTITGIVEGLERVATTRRRPQAAANESSSSVMRFQGVRCDEFENPEECNLQRRR